MGSPRKRATRLTLGVALALALTALFATSAFADDTNLVITGGSLGITTPAVGDFQAVTLDGHADQTTATAESFSVTDARGTGEGWKVTAQATQFAAWDGTQYVAGGHTLPASSLSLAQPTVAQDGTTSAVPTINAGPYTLDGGSAVVLASAAIDAGMGEYDFTQGATPLTLSLSAATTYAATYRSVVTIDAVSGP